MTSIMRLFVVVLLPIGMFADSCQVTQKKYVKCLLLQDKVQKCKSLKTKYLKCSENKLKNNSTNNSKTKSTKPAVWTPPAPSIKAKMPKQSLALNPQQIQKQSLPIPKPTQSIEVKKQKTENRKQKKIVSKKQSTKNPKQTKKSKAKKSIPRQPMFISKKWLAKKPKPKQIQNHPTKREKTQNFKPKQTKTVSKKLTRQQKIVSKKQHATKQKQQPKRNSHELYVAGGFSYFEIQQIAGYELNQAIASWGGSVGLNFSLPKIFDTKAARGLYVSTYVSRYSGAKFILQNQVWLQDTIISSYGINIEARYKFTKKETIYFAPFIGLKHKKIEAKAGPTYKHDYYQRGIVVPLGINLGASVSNSFNIFVQISIDTIYLSGEKRYGEWQADPTTRTGPGGLIGFAYRF